jgi:hypothetical protein
MVLLCYEALLEARFGSIGDGVSIGVRECTVWVEHTIGSEIILVAPDDTPS